MKLKKALSLVVAFALLTICFPTSVFAEDINSNSFVSNSVRLCGQQLLSIRNKHTLTTNVARASYLKDICEYFGMDPSTVDYLKESTIACLSDSEEFGFRTVIYSEQVG